MTSERPRSGGYYSTAQIVNFITCAGPGWTQKLRTSAVLREGIFKVPLSFTVCALTCPSQTYRTWVIFKSEIVKLWNCEFSRTRTLECRAWTYQPFRRLYHTKHCFFCESSCSNTLRRRDTERQIDREKKGEGGIERDRDREKKREGERGRETDWLTDWLNFYYTRIEVKAQILSSNLSLIQITNT